MTDTYREVAVTNADFGVDLVERLVAERLRQELTQKQLAERMHVCSATVTNFERQCLHEGRSPSLGVVARYADALHVNLIVDLELR